jgi:uncharacterized delta-60 repeat protein
VSQNAIRSRLYAKAPRFVDQIDNKARALPRMDNDQHGKAIMEGLSTETNNSLAQNPAYQRKSTTIRLLTFAIFLAFNLVSTAYGIPGQPGTLDTSWGALSPVGAGKVMTPITGAQTMAGIALQSDGKVLLAGTCGSGINADFCSMRYNADGTLDTSWNGTGTTATSVGGTNDAAYAMARQPDGKVLVAGGCLNSGFIDFCAVRYNANGALDTTWSDDGRVITPFGFGNNFARAIALQPDGKVLLAGNCYNASNTNSDFCALRYNADGTVDTSWGTASPSGAGTVKTAIDSGHDFVYGIALQSDGKVLLGGLCAGSINGFCALRYNADGALDTAWNGTGTVITPFAGVGAFDSAIALQPDGKLIVVGYCTISSETDFCALRYNADGSLDTSWAVASPLGPGKVKTSISATGEDLASAVTVQPDGKVLVAGTCSSGSNFAFCALRYHGDGTIDTSWATLSPLGVGKVRTPIAGIDDTARAVAVQPDGKVLLAGYCLNGAVRDFCALRYDGGPFGYKACSPDIDGDGETLATTDALISARVMLGMTDSSVLSGVSFAAHAVRTTWPAIREYLVTQCGMRIP